MAAAAKKKGKASAKSIPTAIRGVTPIFVAKQAHPAVRSVLGAAVTLDTFMATTGTLTLAERMLLVDQALILMSENYVHLPLKRAMHATDPVQALRLLKIRLEAATTATMGSEVAFHSQMLRIFASVRDLHTNYLLPAPYNRMIAFVPFDLEEYFVGDVRHYQVSHLVGGFTHATFEPGVEVTGWSGVPIERAVELSAERNAGSNEAARHSRGLQYLALRPLIMSLPPDERWVDVDYIDKSGTARVLRVKWLVFSPDPTSPGGTFSGPEAAALGVDVEMEMATRAKRVLFAPKAVAAMKKKKPRLTTQSAAVGQDVPTMMAGVFTARNVATSKGDMGHLRIYTFSAPQNIDPTNFPQRFIEEAARLISLLPQDKLVLDLRGNGGGYIYASEGLLQLFTPRQITPEPTQFIVSPLNRRICFANRNARYQLGKWLPSIDQARVTNAVYSAAIPLTPVDFANAIGQLYRGRVLAITDARCYSATDIFAAGFQDHQIGLVLGVDANTGAGGANVWDHGTLIDTLVPNSAPYVPLPKGAGMRVSIRRTLRVHDLAGSPVEDLGVEPDKRWNMTRNDLLNSNADLLEHAATLLDAQPLRTLEAVAGAIAVGMRPIQVTTGNVSRLDIFVNERPYGSQNVTAGTVTISVPQAAQMVRFDGYSGKTLVASNRLPLP